MKTRRKRKKNGKQTLGTGVEKEMIMQKIEIEIGEVIKEKKEMCIQRLRRDNNAVEQESLMVHRIGK